jgi:DNA-binding beta-propeller fold protein YncE
MTKFFLRKPMPSFIRPLAAVAAAATCASALFAQSNFIPVKAPYAETLVVNTKAGHKELQKLGLHAIPPGQHDYAIIANIFPEKIGKKSSASDLVVVQSGKPSIKKDDKGKFFDCKLPIADAAGKPLGMTVMEIPFKFAKDSDEALAKSTVVRDELQAKIPSYARLFEMAEPLKPVQTIQLPAGKTKFDHFGVDLVHHRLFATPEDQHKVYVMDLNSGRMLAEIQGIAKPHAILYRSDLDRIYVTDGVDGAVKIFDGKNYELLKSIPLAKDADSIGYEPARDLLYVVNGGKDAGQPFSLLSVIDTTGNRKVAEIRIDGETLEAMAIDIWRPRGYVNDKAKNSVVVVDRLKNVVAATWPVTMGQNNVAMALDEQHQRLFVGCRSGHVVVFDSNTGKELQALAIPPGIDDMLFDAAGKRLYAVGGGTVSVFEEIDADHFNPLSPVTGAGKAATGTLVSSINRYFVAVPSSDAAAPSVQVFEPVNVLPASPAETPEKVSVHAPKALELDFATMAAHPDLRKMGLHAVPPGGRDSVIIANTNTTRIGNKSSEGDLDSTKDGKTSCSKRDDGAFYGVKQPLKDASGRRIGILVMEIPYTSAANEAQAIQKGEAIGHELAQQIPSYQSLFQ